jgi:hypothetical protein
MINVYALCATKLGTHLIGAEAIEWAQGTDFSHVAILFDTEEPYVIESVAPVSRKISFEEWNTHYREIRRYKQAEISEAEAFVFCMCMVDIPYSCYQLFLIAVQNFVRKILKAHCYIGVKNGVLHCSEMYAVFVQIFRKATFKNDRNLIDLVEAEESMKLLRMD